MTRPWRPTFLESRCLEQLDHAENWRMLDREMPPADELLPWKPFQRIFWFNLVVFGVVFAGLGVAFLVAAGSLTAESLLPAAGAVVLLTVVMSLVATNLYRRAWNRRAKAYLEE